MIRKIFTALRTELPSCLRALSLFRCGVILAGSAILAFGLYNIHARTGVTEGGVLGMLLLLRHWFGISPAVSGIVLDAVCYFIGWKVLGGEFLLYSAVSAGGFSLFYALFERFPPILPNLTPYPLEASVLGALFVGVGVGLSVRMGGASGGDDALAMSLSRLIPCKIETVYLVSDLAVLGLSLTYIPVRRILYSLLTVVLSGQIIGWVQRIELPPVGRRKHRTKAKDG